MSDYDVYFSVVDKDQNVVLRGELFQGEVDAQDEKRVEAAFEGVDLPEDNSGSLTANLVITKTIRRKVKLTLKEALRAEKSMLAQADNLLAGTAAKHGIDLD